MTDKEKLEAATKKLDAANDALEQAKAELNEERAAHDATRKSLDQVKDDVAEITKTAEAESKRADDAETARDTSDRDLKAATVERDAAKAELAKAAKAPSAKPARLAKLRPAGPIAGEPDRDAIDAAIADGAEIVLSDGETEIEALDPMTSVRSAWVRTPRGWMLDEPIRLKPKEAVTIRGYALFDASGKQLAWSERFQPIDVPAMTEVELKREIIF